MPSPPIESWHWLAFGGFVLLLLVLDLGVFHRKSQESTLREAAVWTIVWCILAIIFNAIIWQWQGSRAGQEFLTGYLIEWSLSMDNVFVFAVIFGYFRVPKKYQHRVLFWGILGAVFMRLTFILVGKEVVERFNWVLPLLGLVLIFSGVKLSLKGDTEVDPSHNPIFKLAKKLFPLETTQDHGHKFFVRFNNKLHVTPLFLVLLVVESTDVVFAVDSVPAIFGVVSNKATYFSFVVFTSNVFAILGLRALYFLLAGMMDLFRYLGYGLSAILIFVGIKMILEFLSHQFHWTKPDEHLFSPLVSLCVVLSILGISIGASIWANARNPQNEDTLADDATDVAETGDQAS